ncbi:hypothetical protein J2W49_003870 [Hydrogenophaga palleronii]|uniref:Uncharacterized protein n=1 Tax=Hydrogenophaga palleronii TaxID=65655 RepID=A0ABU1WRG4_9BURK|nr:hypothetical protein [Hydrogenophaga palleronii]
MWDVALQAGKRRALDMSSELARADRVEQINANI